MEDERLCLNLLFSCSFIYSFLIYWGCDILLHFNYSIEKVWEFKAHFSSTGWLLASQYVFFFQNTIKYILLWYFLGQCCFHSPLIIKTGSDKNLHCDFKTLKNIPLPHLNHIFCFTNFTVGPTPIYLSCFYNRSQAQNKKGEFEKKKNSLLILNSLAKVMASFVAFGIKKKKNRPAAQQLEVSVHLFILFLVDQTRESITAYADVWLLCLSDATILALQFTYEPVAKQLLTLWGCRVNAGAAVVRCWGAHKWNFTVKLRRWIEIT